MTLTDRVLQSGVLPKSGICTVAFSGGADSTALLLCLHELQETTGITVQAVHVHHGIRGGEADRDAAFCRQFCEAYGIAFQCVHVDAPALAEREQLSLETAARKLRYEALEQAAPTGVIATAHHAADNAETMLFHLIRGSGMRGLCGIPPRNGRVIRPMLQAEKTEILRFLAERGQTHMEDSSNASAESSRNRLRHQVLPLLEAENPAFLRHISRTAEVLSEDEAYLTAQAQAVLSAGYDPLKEAFPLPERCEKPIRMRMYMLRLRTLGIDPSFDLLHAIDALVTNGSGKICVSGNVYAQTSRGMLYIAAAQAQLSDSLPLAVGENRFFSRKSCIAEMIDTCSLSQNHHESDMQYSLDPDKIMQTPYFRQWRGNDRILLPKQTHSKSLKTCVQAAVPEPERRTLYALYDGEGCIFCEQIGIAQRVMPDANTKQILTLRFARPTD